MTYQITFRAMGTSILVDLDCQEHDAQLLREVPGWFNTWESHFSRFQSDSELSRLNRSAGSPVAVSPLMWEMLTLALQVERQTDGWITPTVLNALEAAGYDKSFDWMNHPGSESSQSTPAPAGMTGSLILDEKKRRVTLPPGIRLDFGGVAKGWAVHQTMLRLQQFGPTLVDGGGDISVSAPLPDGRPWPVDIENPLDPSATPVRVEIFSGALATSGRNRRKWQHGNTWQHHLINPFLGIPSSSDIVTCSVIAADVIQSEAAAKRIFLMGSSDGLAWAESQDQLASLIYTEDGQEFRSGSFNEMKERQKWR